MNGDIFDVTYVIRDEALFSKCLAFIRANWKAMQDRGEPMLVHLSAETARRSVQQNSRYWALLSDISASAWVDGKQFSRQAWHEHFRQQYLAKIEGPDGVLYPVSTTDLNVREFSQYIGQIEAHAVCDLGLELT